MPSDSKNMNYTLRHQLILDITFTHLDENTFQIIKYFKNRNFHYRYAIPSLALHPLYAYCRNLCLPKTYQMLFNVCIRGE